MMTNLFTIVMSNTNITFDFPYLYKHIKPIIKFNYPQYTGLVKNYKYMKKSDLFSLNVNSVRILLFNG